MGILKQSWVTQAIFKFISMLAHLQLFDIILQKTHIQVPKLSHIRNFFENDSSVAYASNLMGGKTVLKDKESYEVNKSISVLTIGTNYIMPLRKCQ